MNPHESALWERLRTAGLVSAEAAPGSGPVTPWYLSLLIGFAAWFAALFLLGFVGAILSDLWDEAAPLAIMGLLFCAGAVWMLRQPGSHDFLIQLAIVFSLTGQLMFAVGIAQFSNNFATSGFFSGLGLVGVAMAFASANKQHRFLASAIACVGAYGFLFEAKAEWLAPLLFAVAAEIWLVGRELRLAGLEEHLRPVAYAVSIALVFAVGFATFNWRQPFETAGPEMLPAVQALALALAALLLVTVGRIAFLHTGNLANPKVLFGLAALAVLCGLLLQAPGVIAGLLLLVLGFFAASRILLAIALAALLVYLARYYYELDTTLLTKSWVLIGSGVALVGLRLLARVLWREKAAA